MLVVLLLFVFVVLLLFVLVVLLLLLFVLVVLGGCFERFPSEYLHDLPHVAGVFVVESDVEEWAQHIFADGAIVDGLVLNVLGGVVIHGWWYIS